MAEQWSLDGTYMEACTCEAACPCVFMSPPTEGDCKGLVAWHIDKGHMGETSLDGLNVALALHSPGNMKDGQWKVALYLDDRATDAQQEALTTIFGGQAGGHPAKLGQFIGEVMGVSRADIDYKAQGKRYSVKIGDVAAADIEAIEGQNGEPATIQGHPLGVAPGYPNVVARSTQNRYKDHGYDWSITNRNGLFSPFNYEGP